MLDPIRRALQWMRLLFCPGTGTRRRTRHRTYLCLHITAVRHPVHPVHPSLVEGDPEAALQQRRRLALVLAADLGIDLDSHLIGAREVAA
ncbi:hypothetical protein J8N05_05135 [Streptomyces sp. BH-SS-21]|uniref:Uncharacterized protein n=1 Tax=Streptomyces liliiviolaceus TaxID=2823109 RepID=A0A940XKB9_9ACTN|nr:hypothetical protein [Streptomyces liliiviolaceus]MBQ0847609.1 hypothetical protein [Streptomyces liliiviolaceus]